MLYQSEEVLSIPHRIVSLGRVGSFFANELIGHPYGLSYEIHDKKLKRLPPRTTQEIGMSLHTCLKKKIKRVAEETDATNELINDGELVQPLSVAEIEGLKKSGVHASV